VLCVVLCLVTLFIMFLLWLAYRVAKAGIEIGPYGTDPFGSSFPRMGGGRGLWRRGGGFGGGSFGGGGFRGGPTMRGGGGSGRSGRGN
jgi:hypothetical protein